MDESLINPVEEKAALLIAKSELTVASIAAEVGVHDQTIYAWKRRKDFAARVKELKDRIREEITSIGIAEITNRLKRQSSTWQKLRQIISERAESEETAHIPGGKTGLIVHNVKGVGVGDNFQLVDLYEVDTGLLKELREHEKHAAQELGQWQETRPVEVQKHEVKIEWPEQEAARLRAAFNLPEPPLEATAKDGISPPESDSGPGDN